MTEFVREKLNNFHQFITKNITKNFFKKKFIGAERRWANVSLPNGHLQNYPFAQYMPSPGQKKIWSAPQNDVVLGRKRTKKKARGASWPAAAQRAVRLESIAARQLVVLRLACPFSRSTSQPLGLFLILTPRMIHFLRKWCLKCDINEIRTQIFSNNFNIYTVHLNL